MEDSIPARSTVVPFAGSWGIAVSAVMLSTGCVSPAPRPIAYGQEPCAHCHMTITDPRYAAELVTGTGKTYEFDDVGCLAAWYIGGTVDSSRVHSLWVNDFVRPEHLLKAETAVYLRSDSLRTPMASGLAALEAGREADSVRAALGGPLLSWSQVVDETRRQGGRHSDAPIALPGPS
jgi:copper chaperone NosL